MAIIRAYPARIGLAVLSILAMVGLRSLLLPVVHPDHDLFIHGMKERAYEHDLGHAEFDFIVVGGGQSGLVLGNRLSEDGRNTVLVVEYGYLYRDDPVVARPWRPYNESAGIYHDPKMLFNMTSTPQVALNNRTTSVEAASVVGGGSTINGMFMNRGAKEDYDAWEKLGNPGWGWADLLPYFKKSVTFTPPEKMLQEEFNVTFDEKAAYGKKGPIHISNPSWAWPGQNNQIAGWEELGVPRSAEGAGGDAVGVFWVPRAQDPETQTRSYSVTGHLDAAMKRKNFHLATGQKVVKLWLSDQGRAEAVEMQIRGGSETRVVRARKEIVMCAGMHSAVIMQRSGIGPKHVLESAGIKVLKELPGVGMNFQDHPTGGLGHEYKTDLELNPSILHPGSELESLAQAEYDMNRTGPYIGGHNAVVFLPAQNILPSTNQFIADLTAQKIEEYLPALYAGDETLTAGYLAQRVLIKKAITSPNSTIMEIPLPGDSFVLMILQKPLSRGTITLDPLNPYDGDPIVDFGTLRNPLDMDVLVATARLTRRWTQTNAMRALTPVENWPGTDHDSDEELREHLRGMAGSSIGHESGGCSMLPLDKGGVVGPDLLVYGVSGLSVADASVFPLIPSTNLCTTVYAVAEKAADIIKKRHAMKVVMQT